MIFNEITEDDLYSIYNSIVSSVIYEFFFYSPRLGWFRTRKFWRRKSI